MFFLISTHFTATPGIPLTSTSLKNNSFKCSLGHLGEFLFLLELLGRISEPFFYCLHTDRFVNLGSLERISNFVALILSTNFIISDFRITNCEITKK